MMKFWRRILSVLLTLAMVMTSMSELSFPVKTAEAATTTAVPSVVLPVRNLPDIEMADGFAYVGFATEQGNVSETGTYSFLIQRAGDVSKASSVIIETVDISAKYGVDYLIEDSRWTTEVLETTGMLIELSGDELNRQASAEIMNEIRDNILGSATAEKTTLTADDIDDSSSLAALKARQSGQAVRETYESEFTPLTENLMNGNLNTDVADYVETSSKTAVTFAPGETELTITFRVLEDTESEGQEMFNLLLSGGDETTVVIESVRSLSFIIEDDEPVEHSIVTFSKDSYSAVDGVVKITLTRDVAPYSYVTIGVRGVGDDYSGISAEAVFQPYQTTTVAEILVPAADEETTFQVELFDYKGADPGVLTTAQVTVPADTDDDSDEDTEPDDSYLSLFGSDHPLLKSAPDYITLDKTYSLKKDANNPGIYYIMDGNNAVGEYHVPVNSGLFRPCKGGDESKYSKIEVLTDGNERIHLLYGSRYYADTGWVGVDYTVYNPQRYRLVMLDMDTLSEYESSHVGYNYRVYDGNGNQLADLENWIYKKNSRKPRVGTALLWNNAPIAWWQSYAVLRMWVERAAGYLVMPEANIYGIVLMYKEYHINVAQPDYMEFRSGALKSDGSPVMEQRRPASVSVANDVRYVGQSIQMIEAPAAGNEVIYGELEGYKIKPLEGTEFFYKTNSTTLYLNDELIREIDKHTSKMQSTSGRNVEGGAALLHTQITIKPVYKYKNVQMILENPTGLPEGAAFHYADKDLEAQRTNKNKPSVGVFHVGDKLNLTMTTEETGYYFSNCWRAQYVNPGDTAYDQNRSGDLPLENGKAPTTVIVYTKCVGRGTFSNTQNYIRIKLDETAQKYFVVENTVPQSKLTESYMKGQYVLNTAEATVKNGEERIYTTEPVSGRAYTVTLSGTAKNDGTWRPVITFKKTGQTVNGFAADFIADNRAELNVVTVTAERIDPSKYQYFSIDGSAVYKAYSLRTRSEKVTSSPAMQAAVIGGGGGEVLWKTIFDDTVWNVKEQVRCLTAVRVSAMTADDGSFRLNGIRAMSGDTISVKVDNNDVQQVAYITLNTAFTETRAVDKMSAGNEKDAEGYYLNKIERVDEKQAVNAVFGTIDMPIRTFYSPYVSEVYFGYEGQYVDTNINQVPIYDKVFTLEITVALNDGDISEGEVLVTKVNRAGIKESVKAKIKDDENRNEEKKNVTWTVAFSGADLQDGDRFYVQLTAKPKGGEQYITYTALDTGIVMYTPKEQAKPQYLQYELPNPYEDLPILRNLAGTVDSGKLVWNTEYAHPDSPGTSDYVQQIIVAVSKADLEKGTSKLEKLKNGQSSLAQQDWENLKGTGAKAYQYLDAMEQAQFADEYRMMNPNATDKEVEDYFNSSTFDKENYKKSIMSGAKKDALAKMGDVNFNCAVKVLLQLEYVYDDKDKTHYYAGGQYLIAFDVTVSKTWYWTIYGVPVFLNITGDISLQFDGRYTTEEGRKTAEEMGYYDDLKEAVKSEWPYIQFGMTLRLQPGVGLCGVLSARGFIDFAFVGRVNVNDESLGGTTGTMSGGFGVDLLLFSFEYKIGEIGWKSGEFDTGASLALRGSKGDNENITLRTVGTGKENSNDAIESTLLPSAKKTLLNGSMEYARPELVDLGDGRMMLLFLRNDPNGDKDDANASTLVYAISDAEGNWARDDRKNIASKVIEKDEGADSTPTVLRIGRKVYIAWTSAEQSIGGENGELTLQSAKEALKSTNIHMAVYDIDKDSLYGPIRVTADRFVNSHPVLAAENGKVSVYYFKRDIDKAESITDLAGLSNNYNTWAKKVYDPEKETYVDVVSGRTNPKEEYIYIQHPTIMDPMVTDLDVSDFRFTDRSGVTKEYCIFSYSVDRDRDLETVDDRELWVQITNVTDGRSYYPVPVDARKENILDPKLTKLGDDVYLTWMSDNSVFNAVSALAIFSGLDAEDGGSGTSSLERVRALSAGKISVSGWYQLPIEEVGGLSGETREIYNMLTRLAKCDLGDIRKDFGYYNSAGKHEGAALTDHQIVAGADGNLYLFWTGPDVGNRQNYGRELYGAALCVNREDDIYGWSNGIQLTNYGKVIDELTICVAGDKDAVMVANVYSQRITEKGNIEYSNHELSEIDFVAGNSLEFAGETIVLSDMYPVEGEKIEAELTIENNGLLPAEKYDLTVNGEKTTVTGMTIEAGEARSIVRGFTAGEGGALEVSAKVVELNGNQPLAVSNYGGNKVTVKTKNGAVMNFGTAKIYGFKEDLLPQVDASINEKAGQYSPEEFNAYLDSVLEPLDPEVQAILRATLTKDDYSDYVACVPVTNIGNVDGKNLKASAVVVTEEWKDVDEAVYGSSRITEVVYGESVGTGEISLVPVKTVNEDGEVETQTVYAVIPLKGLDFRRDVNDLGMFRVDIQFTLDGQDLSKSCSAEYHIRRNVELTVNNGADTVEIKEGENVQLTVEAYPWNGLAELTYIVDDSSVAAVTADGKVAGLKPGKTILTISDGSSPDLSAQVMIVVTEDSSTKGVYQYVGAENPSWEKKSGDALSLRFKRTTDDEKTFANFIGVKNGDNKLVENKDFVRKEGSVIVELQPDYLETLPVGKTVLTASFVDGDDVTVEIGIKAESETKPEVSPTVTPTEIPTVSPTVTPTEISSETPSVTPTEVPSVTPVVTVTPEVTPTITPTPEKTPSTGDAAPIRWWMILAFISLCAIGVFAVRKQRRRR